MNFITHSFKGLLSDIQPKMVVVTKFMDGLNELDRYTMGYVDNYLHDGKSMIAEAKKKRSMWKTVIIWTLKTIQ